MVIPLNKLLVIVCRPEDAVSFTGSTTLHHGAGTQLFALFLGRFAIALPEIGALFILQYASLLGLVAGGQGQNQAGTGEQGYQLVRNHQIFYKRPLISILRR